MSDVDATVRHNAISAHEERYCRWDEDRAGHGSDSGPYCYGCGLLTHDGVDLVLEALRALPVEERMEAMGMRRVNEYDDPDRMDEWVEK